MCFRSGHSIVLSQGVLSLRSSGSEYAGESRAWWFESDEFVRPLFTADLMPMRWGAETGRFNPDGWYFQVSLWPLLLFGIVGSGLLLGLLRPGQAEHRRTRLVRLAIPACAFVLVAMCVRWHDGQHFAVLGSTTIAFPSGGVTITRLSLGNWGNASGPVSFLPRYLGPRDLEAASGAFMLEVPLWHLALVAAGTAGWMHGAARGARRRTGCSKCGYPTEGRETGTPCPECGSVSSK